MGNSRPLNRGWWQDTYWKIYLNLDDGTEVGHESGKSTRLAAWQIGVLPAWQTWRHITHNQVRHIWIAVDAPQIPASVARKHFWNTQVLPSTRFWREQAEAIAATIYELDNDRPPSWPQSCRAQAVVYRIFEHLTARLASVESPPEPVRLAMDQIESDIAGDLRIGTLVGVAGVGEKTLNAAFRKSIGVSAAEYVRERRIARAADLLLSSEWSIDRIASEAGFPNRHYLSRVFAKRMGMAPAAYRAHRPVH
jgi:AraC-like DNA-binding protein